ncbi:hypothetical protein Esi_0119_0081 [Ectocarpus siliculosus]|uniref:Uncharacterized protein n=1 Tax=Ectocarpus siliculosus TaxID=2880 RepID=D7FID5_ECTSI|nr:hypothetical protein Esi_0119_0081 [Ectocarpus siliculosus]|eukprot:CBJ28759.1 hypothetical protein Esi_0119_0081 [Ectocarpus siliculosus]
MVENSRTENTAGSTAEKVDEVHAVASFGAISVSSLKLGVAEDLDGAERPIVIRLSDQHGNHRETTPRTCSNVNPLAPSDGRATAWCEELQMPILPGVDAILFEIFLVAKPAYTNHGCGNPETTDTIGSGGSVPTRRDRLGPANPADHHHEPQQGSGSTEGGCKTPRSGGAPADPNRESQPYALIGAVALLLSEVVGAWRTMESPLFDIAGGVAGRIRMAAIIVGRPNPGPGGPLEGERRRSRGDAKRSEPPSALEDDDCTPTRLPAAEVAEAERGGPCGCRRKSEFSPTSPCCCRQHGRRGSGGSGSRGGLPPFSRSEDPAGIPAEQGDLLGGAPAAAKVGCCSRVGAVEMVPKAVILYRGMKLPFRWLRSGTARLMDKSLRQMLGINDTSIASPALYDVDNGGSSSSPQHVRSSRSSRRVGATGFGHDDGQGLRPQLSLPKKNVCPSGAPSAIRRSASDGSLRRFIQHAVVTTTTGDGIVAGLAKISLGCACLNSVTGESDVAFWKKGNFAREVTERQQRLTRKREEKNAEEEKQRRLETEHAKAVAGRLAHRVLCRVRRTRVLALALWRWRLQASKLKLQQDMEEKQGREHKQAIALLEGLREEVASLTATAYEGLVAVSIDALERDLNDSDAADHQGMTGQSVSNATTPDALDKEGVDRAATALKTDIARLSRLRAERNKCVEERLVEIHAIKDAAAACDGPPTPTVAAASTAHIKHAAASRTPAKTRAGGAGTGNDGDPNNSPSVNGPGEHGGTGAANAEQRASFSAAGQLGRGGGTIHRSERDFSEHAFRGGSGDDRLTFHAPSPSPSATTKSAGIKGSGSRGRRQAAAADARAGDVWESIRNKDDAILENFLTRHTRHAFELLGGKARLAHARARGVYENEEGTGGARLCDADSGWGSSLLWALFRHFSDCSLSSPTSLQRWSKPVTAGSVSRETATAKTFSDVRGSPREPSASSIDPPRASESGRSRRKTRCLPPEGLNFSQFETALEGVLEVLTVGSGEPCFGCGGGGREDDSEKNIVGYGGIGEGGEGDIGSVVGGGNAIRQRTVTMAQRFAMAGVVQLAKELATKELLARDCHARETFALLDPSLQYILDVNEQILHEIFAHYCRRYALSPILPRGDNDSAVPGRAEGGSDLGGVGRGGGDGGRSGSDIVPRRTALGLRFEGGTAFAREFGLTTVVGGSIGALPACLHACQLRLQLLLKPT